LIYQYILYLATRMKFKADGVVAQPLGYYWEPELGSFTEIHEWVEGRYPCYEADPLILHRLFGIALEEAGHEMQRKKRFMQGLVDVCHEIGAIGLARQYEWFTLISQANVLSRESPKPGLSDFVAVDCRPGLAVPFFLPLSPAHARIILEEAKRGVFAHFDAMDLSRLERFVQLYFREDEDLSALTSQVNEENVLYRAGLLDIWNARANSFLRSSRLQSVKQATIQDWVKLRMVSPAIAERLGQGWVRFLTCFILDNLPMVGGFMLRLTHNEIYQRHLLLSLVSVNYREGALQFMRSRDVGEWREDRRITCSRVELLEASTIRYLFEKLVLSWQPRILHRLVTDPSARRDLFQKLVTALPF